VDHAVELAPALFEVSRYRLDVFRFVHVELQDGRFGVEASGGAGGEVHGLPEAAKRELRPLLGGKARHREGDGAPVQDAGYQYLLAFQQPAHPSSYQSSHRLPA
jgi:hypothetical protein